MGYFPFCPKRQNNKKLSGENQCDFHPRIFYDTFFLKLRSDELAEGSGVLDLRSAYQGTVTDEIYHRK